MVYRSGRHTFDQQARLHAMRNCTYNMIVMSLLGKKITRDASWQTYITVKLLVDRPLQDIAYDAYAYFRWLDDEVDAAGMSRHNAAAIIRRQRDLVRRLYRGTPLPSITPHEELLAHVIRSNPSRGSQLYVFISRFCDIIEFDAGRKGRHITSKELRWYTDTLSLAVMSGLEYFIHSEYRYPDHRNHYSAPAAAHILHMLRDYREDMAEGYYNFPPSLPTPVWVKKRAEHAKRLMKAGKTYIESLPHLRSQIAGMWYCARFEWLLPELEKNNYSLDHVYTSPRIIVIYTRMVWVAVRTSLKRII